MSHSRRTLSLATLVLILGSLSAGVWWRLGGKDGGQGGAGGEAAASPALPGDLPDLNSAREFSTDVPQPVRGVAAVRDTLWIRVRAAGRAEAFRQAVLQAQADADVAAVSTWESRRVVAGERLIQLDTTDLALEVARARADLLDAEAEYRQMILFDDEIADPELRADRERIARTRSGLEQAEVALRQAEIDLARTAVKAPFEGRVADLEVVRGQRVTAGTELLTVVDLDPMKVEVQVLERDLPLLAEGRRADVRFSAYPGEAFRGRVETINPMVDPETRTARVTVLLDNPDHRIVPGMYAEVALDAEAIPDRILVPRAAILERGEGRRRTMLFVYEGDGERGLAKWRYVSVGRENDTHVEILPDGEGIVDPGEVVLVDGHHYLAHDTPIRLVEDVAAEGGRPGR